MEQLTLPEYQERKQRIKDRLNQTVENFIVIGYELRQIRDTESFRLDGYSNLADFAKAEFNLSPDTVSRFISINVKLTVEGEGVELLPELKGMGYSKLQDVLQLPADDYQLLTPKTTVKEIRELKKFNHGDATAVRQAVPVAETILTPLRRCIKDFFSAPGHRNLLNDIMKDAYSPDYNEAIERRIADEINPAGTRTHQKGLIYLFMYDYNRGVSYKQMGKPQPVNMSWHDFIEEIKGTFAGLTDEQGETWCNAFGPAPEEEKVAIPGQMSIADMENATSQEKKGQEAPVREKKESGERKIPEKRQKPDPKIGMDAQELKLLKAAVINIEKRTPALKALDNLQAKTIVNVLLQIEPQHLIAVEGTGHRLTITQTAVQIARNGTGYSWGIEYFAKEIAAHIQSMVEKEAEELQKEQELYKSEPEESLQKEIPADSIREVTDNPEDLKEEAPEENPPAAVMDPDHAGEEMTELWERAKLSRDKLNLLFGEKEVGDASFFTLHSILRNAETITNTVKRIVELKEN